jgi:short-subunit dehydrogenase
VTGASRGIGEALARAFAERGCAVGLVSRSEQEQELRELAEALPGEGHEPVPADVTDAGALAGAVERFGAVDVVIANAGVSHYIPFAELPLDLAEQMTRVNWLGTLYTVKAVLPGMIDRGRGHIVVIASAAAHRSFPQASIYGATKAAQRMFADALRHELADTGVSVTIVYPGEIKTQLHDHERERMPDWYHVDQAVPPEPLAKRVVEAVETDRREVYYPPIVKLLRIAYGISPGLGDRILRRMRGENVAPRR